MASAGPVLVEKAYAIVRRSYPFRELSRQKFDTVLKQIAEIGLVFINGDEFKRSGRGRKYFYDNISMIPDERTYRIRDIGSRKIVGTLDGASSFRCENPSPPSSPWFVADRGHPGRRATGRAGRERRFDVRRGVGEDIPVPFEVAQEVGRMRGYDRSAYHGDGHAYKALDEYLDEHREKFPMPTDQRITLEVGKKLAILNMCFGSKVNETISRCWQLLLSARLGESVAVTTGSSTVIIDLPDVAPSTIVDTLRSINASAVESLMPGYEELQPHALALRLRGQRSSARWRGMPITATSASPAWSKRTRTPL